MIEWMLILFVEVIMLSIVCLSIIDGIFVGLTGKSACVLLSDLLKTKVSVDNIYEVLSEKDQVSDVELDTMEPNEYFDFMVERKYNIILKGDKDYEEFCLVNCDGYNDDWPYMAEIDGKDYVLVVIYED